MTISARDWPYTLNVLTAGLVVSMIRRCSTMGGVSAWSMALRKFRRDGTWSSSKPLSSCSASVPPPISRARALGELT
jgi:hypothetical protein